MEEPQFLCVEYPGLVKDEDKMIETLGGLDHISHVFSESNRKLELKFRPGVPGAKPTSGELKDDTGILIKVKRMKNVKTGEIKVVHEVVGSITGTYKFEGFCDFQLLPMEKTKDDEYKSIRDELVVKKLMSTKDMKEDSTEKSTLFLPPMAFSRMDTPQDYQFRKEMRSEKIEKDMPDNIIGRTRQRRSLFNMFLTYDAETIPDGPQEQALQQVKAFAVEKKNIAEIRAMFQQQPIWLKAELAHKVKTPHKHLKYILPVVAYYFSSGPWRNQWIRFGYDPRKQPEAAELQTLDYRLRMGAGARQLVQSKRKTIMTKHKVVNSSKARTSLIEVTDKFAKEGPSQDMLAEKEEKVKDAYLFRSGRLPPSRQIFYQLKNICLPEVNLLITKYKISQCDEKNGWFKSGLDDKLRNLLAETIKQTCYFDDGASVLSSTLGQPSVADDEDEEEAEESESEED